VIEALRNQVVKLRFKHQLGFQDGFIADMVLFHPFFNERISGFEAVHCERYLYGTGFSQTHHFPYHPQEFTMHMITEIKRFVHRFITEKSI
jgi:hypothetical protein